MQASQAAERRGQTVAAPAAPAGFRDHDARIRYFVKGHPVQNFGDYLPELLARASSCTRGRR
jgi:hypothetical protein